MEKLKQYLAMLLALQAPAQAAGIPRAPLLARAPVTADNPPAILVTKTVIRTFSREYTFYNPFGLSPRTWLLFSTTGAVTRYEPVPTAYPAKITVEETTSVTIFSIAPFSTYSTETVTAETAWTDTQTWALSRPRATDAPALLPPGTDLGAACVACPGVGDASPAAVPDPACEALGLRTGCDAAQCPQDADGTYWCREMFPGMYTAEGYRNGRACWGNGTQYKQLLAPCRVGDGVVGCTACKGDLRDFFPKNWL